MRLLQIEPQHFGPFVSPRPLEFEPDVTVLTGPNDVGKSLTLRLIDLAVGGGKMAENEVNRYRFDDFPQPWVQDSHIACNVVLEVKETKKGTEADRGQPKAGDRVTFKAELATGARHNPTIARGGKAIGLNTSPGKNPTVLMVSSEPEIRDVVDLGSMMDDEEGLVRLGFGPQFTLDQHRMLNEMNRSFRVAEATRRLNDRLAQVLPPTLPLRFQLLEVGGKPEQLGLMLVDEHLGFTPLGSRGTGVRRMITMMATLLQLNPATGHVIILLDEPETSLHADAQHMLRRVLEGLGRHPNIQVIYSTHSSAMINALRPETIRVLQREQADGKATTKFINRAYHGNFSLVRSSLGVTPGDSLLYAPITIVIEGPTETLCLPLALEKLDEAEVFGDIDMESLLSQTHILDGEGSKFSVMIPLAKSQNAQPIVFLDGDKQRDAAVVRVDHPDVAVIVLPPGKEFEDLVPPEVYVTAVVELCELDDPDGNNAGFRKWEAAEEADGRLKRSHLFSKRVERWLHDVFDKTYHKPSAMRAALEKVDAKDIMPEPFKELVEAMKAAAAKI